MKARTLARHRRWAVAVLLSLLLAAVLPASTAVRVQRPITYDGGRINQEYLWNAVWNGIPHRGVDFTYTVGTDVYAIADGVVMDLREDIQNGEGSGFGNYVLIRHTRGHWNRTTGQMGYVYSIYAHLSQDTVRYSVGQPVDAGNWIAEVDDTGTSSGNHLHLQICVDDNSDQTLSTLSSSTTSRNPELWLQAFNSGGTNTGTAVGKVTDTDGQPIGDRYIWGLSKPQGSGGTNYVSSRTYAYTWANPDDILVENWGTTDILPDTYHLTVRNESGTTTYEDLGWHTVEAGKTTYVGLYPVYLPDIMENYYNWSSSIRIRNNSDSKTAQVNTTFFRYDGAWVHGQKTDYILPRGTVEVDFPGSCYYCRGSAMVVASEDVSVVVKNDGPDGVTSYTGIGAQGGSTGWDEPGQTVYVPASLRNYYGWDSVFSIQNTGSGDASGSITFYNGDGTPKHTEPDLSISANGQERVRLDEISDLGDGFFGSAVISFDQPVAVVVRQEGGSSGYSDFNAFTSGADVLYLPSLLNGYYGWDSAYQIQNVGTQAASISVRYEFGNSYCIQPLGIVQAKGYVTVYQPTDDCFEGETIGSARITSGSNRPIVAIVNQQNSTGSHQSYSALLGGATTLDAPLFVHDVDDWNSSLQVQNMDVVMATIDRDYYRTDGDSASGGGSDTIAGWKSKAYIGGDGTPSGHYYSAVVTSNRQMGGICNTSRSGSGDVGCSYNMIAR